MTNGLRVNDMAPIGERPADIIRGLTGSGVAGVDSLLGIPFSGSPADGQFPYYDATTDELDWLDILGLFGTIISPTALTGSSADDWNPPGLSGAAVIRMAMSADGDLSGIEAPAATGQRTVILLANVSAFSRTLKHDVTSTAANRFSLPGAADVPLPQGSAALLWYDPISTRWRLAGGAAGSPRKHAVNAIFDGGAAVIATGKYVRVKIPWACTITRVTMLSDASTTATVDIWRTTQSSYDGGVTHPVVGDSIVGADIPTITASTKSDDSALTAWGDTTLDAGDVLEFYLASNSAAVTLTVALEVQP